MHQFRNDYSEGAAPEVLDALIRTNDTQTVGYGEDEHCAHAAELIRHACAQADAQVRFLPGGGARHHRPPGAHVTRRRAREPVVLARPRRSHRRGQAVARWYDVGDMGKTRCQGGVMDVSRIKRPEDWPFELTEDSRFTIQEFIDGLASDKPHYLIAYMQDEIHAALRSQTEEEEEVLRRYYLKGGWRADVC